MWEGRAQRPVPVQMWEGRARGVAGMARVESKDRSDSAFWTDYVATRWCARPSIQGAQYTGQIGIIAAVVVGWG